MFGNKKSGAAGGSKGAAKGGVLPPSKYRMGGKHFKNDDAFIKTAVRDVKRLERLAGLNENSRLLDWFGIGLRFAGGLAIAFLGTILFLGSLGSTNAMM